MRRGGTIKIIGNQIGTLNRTTATRRRGYGPTQPDGSGKKQVPIKRHVVKLSPYIVKSDEYYDYMSNGVKKVKDVSMDKFEFKSSKYKQLRKNIAINIKKIRSDKGLNCEDLAQEARMTRQYIGQIEKEKKNITIEKLCDIASALEVDVGFLISKAPFSKSEQYIHLLVTEIRKLSPRKQIDLCVEIINKLNNKECNEA